MNFNQGMRRLAIFAGVLGAVAGGFYAYRDLRKVPSDRYQHDVFEKLAASDIVNQIRSQRLLEAANGTPFIEDSSSDVDNQPNAVTSSEPEIKGLPPGAIVEPLNGSTTKPPPMTLPKDFSGRDRPTATNGIKTIYWKPDFSVDSFEMLDGGVVSSKPAPSAWSYFLWVVFPALGFFIVWGAIRGIAWVGAGFFQMPK